MNLRDFFELKLDMNLLSGIRTIVPTSDELSQCGNREHSESLPHIKCTRNNKTDDRYEALPSIKQMIAEILIYAFYRWSVLISLAQIIFLMTLLYYFGAVSLENNPYLGPSVNTLIKFGAKDAELIVSGKEYWRLLVAIMLHAGLYHLIGNVTLQLLISGYLEHTWGIRTFLTIYFTTGIVGYLCSCNFLYSSVSVGSSGSIMGLLASWLVDIAFSLNRMRNDGTINTVIMRNQYIMFYSVMIAVATTLATSWNSGVDWASHTGGCIYGFVWGYVLFYEKREKEFAVLPVINRAPDSAPAKKLIFWMTKFGAAILLFGIPTVLILCMMYFTQDV